VTGRLSGCGGPTGSAKAPRTTHGLLMKFSARAADNGEGAERKLDGSVRLVLSTGATPTTLGTWPPGLGPGTRQVLVDAPCDTS